MQTELELEQARALVQGIDIPVRPAVLQKVMSLQNSNDPDIGEIAQVISSDVMVRPDLRPPQAAEETFSLIGIGAVLRIGALMVHALYREICGEFIPMRSLVGVND